MLGDHLVFPILLSTDLAKSREFYHETLGLEVIREDEERATANCDIAEAYLNVNTPQFFGSIINSNTASSTMPVCWLFQ